LARHPGLTVRAQRAPLVSADQQAAAVSRGRGVERHVHGAQARFGIYDEPQGKVPLSARGRSVV